MTAQIEAPKQDLAYQKRTKQAILWTSLFNEPLFSIYVLLGVILRKDLDATAFQIALLTMLKPLVAVFSFYWSSSIRGRAGKLRSNMLFAGFLLRLPFLFFPFVENTWFYIASGASYMLFYRAGNPAWMEILKRNLPKVQRDRYYSLGSALGFGLSVLLAILLGRILDLFAFSWKWIFFGSSIIGLFSLALQAFVPINGSDKKMEKSQVLSWKDHVLEPWKASMNLMKQRPDFSRFQWAFMIGGFGLMLFQPVLPLFFVDVLNLSYMDMTIALLICKGLGFCLSSSTWARLMQIISFKKITSLVCILFALFPVLLFLAPVYLPFVYLAHVIYGIASAGSHLVWNLSGPIFAKEEDSSRYSSVNVVMVGIRGAVGPPLGGFLSLALGPIGVLLIGMSLCFFGAARMYFRLKKPAKAISA
ncbi:MAG: hypothetical protein Tsb0015_08410 [Simkaniaceae bacterium]